MDKDIENLYEITQINSKAIKKNAVAAIWNSISIVILTTVIIIIVLDKYL